MFSSKTFNLLKPRLKMDFTNTMRHYDHGPGMTRTEKDFQLLTKN